MTDYDVVIIGAGAVGCAAAYVLSGYKINIAVLEKEADVAFGTSGRKEFITFWPRAAILANLGTRFAGSAESTLMT